MSGQSSVHHRNRDRRRFSSETSLIVETIIVLPIKFPPVAGVDEQAPGVDEQAQ
jgi:hypothetical protein